MELRDGGDILVFQLNFSRNVKFLIGHFDILPESRYLTLFFFRAGDLTSFFHGSGTPPSIFCQFGYLLPVPRVKVCVLLCQTKKIEFQCETESNLCFSNNSFYLKINEMVNYCNLDYATFTATFV